VVRLGWRLDALIEALARAGVVEQSEVEAAFNRLSAGRSSAGDIGTADAIRESPR
jgi:hypothetical protein